MGAAGPVHTTANRATLSQIGPNSSSLYTLFYSVIYNSVLLTFYSRGKVGQVTVEKKKSMLFGLSSFYGTILLDSLWSHM